MSPREEVGLPSGARAAILKSAGSRTPSDSRAPSDPSRRLYKIYRDSFQREMPTTRAPRPTTARARLRRSIDLPDQNDLTTNRVPETLSKGDHREAFGNIGKAKNPKIDDATTTTNITELLQANRVQRGQRGASTIRPPSPGRGNSGSRG